MSKSDSPLDDPARMEALDPAGMRAIVFGFFDQLEDAAGRWPETQGEVVSAPPQRAVLAGMGGSAIGGDVVAACWGSSSPLCLEVWRDYGLPDTTASDTAVLLSSYSGNTEETLTAYAEGRRRRCPMAAITSGGELARLAARDAVPLYRLPEGYPPRGVLAYSFHAIGASLRDLGLLSDRGRGFRLLAGSLRDQARVYRPEIPTESNPAKQIALQLVGSIPFLYTSRQLAAAAVRWRSQLAENSKLLAGFHLVPEMNHNEIVGFQSVGNVLESVVVLLLRDRDEPAAVSRRLDVTAEILQERGRRVIQVSGLGDSPAARLLSLIHLGDSVSFYAAMLQGVDPYPVELIDTLKARL